MASQIKVALLQNDPSGHTFALFHELRAQSVSVQLAKTCKEAADMLASPEPPDLVLTDLRLPDGGWEDVVRTARNAATPVNVIVVSRIADIRLYVEALEKGAFDFITPPFEPAEISHVLRSAYGNVAHRRETQARSSLLREPEQKRPSLALAR